MIKINLGSEVAPLRLVVVRAKTANDTIDILAPGVADPAFVVTLFKVYGEFALVMFAVGALEEILVVGPITGPQHISQYL